MTTATVEDPFATRAADVAAALANAEAHNPRRAVAKLSYTHDAMIDLIIQNPAIAQGELADIFGYTQAWVSIVKNSDAFQSRLAQRRDELVDPTIRATLQERFTAVTARSLEVLQAKLSVDPSKVPDNLVLKAVELGAKALGLGSAPPPPPPTDQLSVLAERLLALQGRSPNRPSEVLVYDEGSAAFEPAHANQPDAAGPPAGQGQATDVRANAFRAHQAASVYCDVGQESGRQNPSPSVMP